MDCLASTGLPVLTWVVLGAAAVAAGLITWFFLRRAGKKGTAALGLVLLLAAGGVTASLLGAPPAQAAALTAACTSQAGGGSNGGGSNGGGGGTTSTISSTNTTTVTSPATPPSTDTGIPTQTVVATTPPPNPPIDLTLRVAADPNRVNVARPASVAYTVVLDNVLTNPTSGPVTVLIEKHAEEGLGATFVGTGWSVDQTTDPSNFIATFTPVIAGNSSSSILTATYPAFSAVTTVKLGSLIKTGSGGDGDTTNNFASATVNVLVSLQNDESK